MDTVEDSSVRIRLYCGWFRANRFHTSDCRPDTLPRRERSAVATLTLLQNYGCHHRALYAAELAGRSATVWNYNNRSVTGSRHGPNGGSAQSNYEYVARMPMIRAACITISGTSCLYHSPLNRVVGPETLMAPSTESSS